PRSPSSPCQRRRTSTRRRGAAAMASSSSASEASPCGLQEKCAKTSSPGCVAEAELLACVDVGYTEAAARAACGVFDEWTDAAPGEVCVVAQPAAAEYQPGSFYLRELPPLHAVLERVPHTLDVVIIDGYVWLGDAQAGLGARLHEALACRGAVVGVAKTPW